MLLWVATYAVGLPDQPRNKRQAGGSPSVVSVIAAIGISIPQLITGDALLPRFVVFGSALALIPWQIAVSGVSRDGRTRAEGQGTGWCSSERPEEHVRLTRRPSHGTRNAPRCSSPWMTPAEAVGLEPGHTPIIDLAARDVGDGRRARPVRGQPTTDVVAQAAALHESGSARPDPLAGFYEEWLGKLPLSSWSGRRCSSTSARCTGCATAG